MHDQYWMNDGYDASCFNTMYDKNLNKKQLPYLLNDNLLLNNSTYMYLGG